jgi:hypothetical protein
VAKQLAIIDFEHFRKLTPYDLLDDGSNNSVEITLRSDTVSFDIGSKVGGVYDIEHRTQE